MPGDTKLLELTSAETRKLCEFQERSYKSALPSSEQACTIDAAQGARDVEECERYRDQCVSEGDYDNERVDDWECEGASIEELFEDEVPTTCDVTVTEVEECIRSALQAYGDAASQASCESFTSSKDLDFETEACRAIRTKCPGLDDDLFG